MPRLACLMLVWLLAGAGRPGDKQRIITYRGVDYLTTWEVPARFTGTYRGSKVGYLLLRPDGTGEYKYDIYGFAPTDCPRQPIQLIWGFLVNDAGGLISRQRDYGRSYPLLLQSTGPGGFQGCRTRVMMDYILDKGGILHVSSSDDWVKK